MEPVVHRIEEGQTVVWLGLELVASKPLAGRLEQQLSDVASEALVARRALEVVRHVAAGAVDNQRDEFDPLFVLEAIQRRIVLLEHFRGVFGQRLDTWRARGAAGRVDPGKGVGQ
ncbi:hypothetical protein C494_03515 [Natronorubrum bangense JCM 10635]|uniref:Uncharacterized protein n=1 Tax=Natronorubrum bangense JCM 10635 TaxID=1227500 RepID=L9WQ99_9EURY|nr:hypothetical protein C494_03515 [Natronorubrum bangense JCM 10635]